MSLCINPHCAHPNNSENLLFCNSCGSQLLLKGIYRVTKMLGGGGFGVTYEIKDCGISKVLKVLHNNHSKAVELWLFRTSRKQG